MATRVVRRITNRPDRSPYARPVEGPSETVCDSWVAGKFDKELSRFLHTDAPPSAMNPHVPKQRVLVWAKEGITIEKGNLCNATQKSSSAAQQSSSAAQQSSNASQKSVEKVCKFWADWKCVKGDRCLDLHKWFRGEGFSMLAKLQGHYKPVTGIALPQGCDKLYSGSADGTTRVWDCHTGRCDHVMNLGGEVGSLISEGPWIFVGIPNVVEAWNIRTDSQFILEVDRPVGQVNTMVVGNEMLFAGTQDGVILVWKDFSETNPFRPAANLKGHTHAVICLTVGGNRLYLGSLDRTIRVWKLDTLQCVMKLDGHSGVVMSLMCWNQFLLSCSLDCTIRVWAATEEGNLEVTYTHNEEYGVIALSGMTDAESKPILLCSYKDNSVHLYELPSFTERGRLFAQKYVRTIKVGPGGLFFSGDATGLLFVWKWMDSGFKIESS